MSVIKFFKVEIDELGAEFLNAPGLKLLLDATLTDEKAEDPFHIKVTDLTDGIDALYKNINALYRGLLQLPLEEEHEPYEDAAVIEEKKEQDLGESVQERNERLRAQSEKKAGPPHNTPGKGILCTAPEMYKEKVGTGGTITFCPKCGHQYKDTDLIQ